MSYELIKSKVSYGNDLDNFHSPFIPEDIESLNEAEEIASALANADVLRGGTWTRLRCAHNSADPDFNIPETIVLYGDGYQIVYQKHDSERKD